MEKAERKEGHKIIRALRNRGEEIETRVAKIKLALKVKLRNPFPQLLRRKVVTSKKKNQGEKVHFSNEVYA